MNKGDVHWFSLIATTKDRTIILFNFSTISVDFTTISVGFLFPKNQDLCSMVIHHQVRIPRCCGRAKFQKLRSPRPAGGDFRVSWQQNSLYGGGKLDLRHCEGHWFCPCLVFRPSFFFGGQPVPLQSFPSFWTGTHSPNKTMMDVGDETRHETTYIWKHRMMNGAA